MENAPDLDKLRVISPEKAADLYGVHVRTLQRMVKAGDAPTPVRVSKGRIGFRLQEVHAALAGLPRVKTSPPA